MSEWVDVCPLDEIDEEDVRRFDYRGRTYAIYRLGDAVCATDGLCTHEHVHLCDGLVMDYVIECPKHNGRFDVRSGKALGAPACVNLVTYAAKVESGRIQICV